MALNFKKISAARVELNNLVNHAHYQGLVTIITIGKAEKAAIVPLSMVAEYKALQKERFAYADTNPANAPRIAEVPLEVTAHSPREHQPEDGGPTDTAWEEELDALYDDLMEDIDVEGDE